MRKEILVENYIKKYGLFIHPEELQEHEDNVGEKVVVPLLMCLGYSEKDIVRKPRLLHTIISKSGVEPDYGIYQYKERIYRVKNRSVSTKQYGIVIDVKKYKKELTKEMEEKLAGYCALAGALYGILTNGEKMTVIEPTRGAVEWKYLDYIPTKKQLEKAIKGEKVEYNKSDIIYATRIVKELTEEEIENIADKCHSIIRSRKGEAVPDRLYEFSKLIIARIIDERRYKNREQNELLITLESLQNMKSKKQNIKDYIKNILQSIRSEIGIFKEDEGVNLPDDVIEKIIEELDNYPLWSEKMDVLGHVYEKFLMNTMTGRELGGYFTPRPVVEAIVKMIDPTWGEKILDPACGSGGFLIAPLMYLKSKHNIEKEEQIKELAKNFYGIDIFDVIAKLCQINLWLHGDCHDNIFRTDSLEPTPTMPNMIIEALKNPNEKGFDIILTNPPFGAKEGNKLTKSRMEEINKKWKEKGINMFECFYGSRGNITLQPQIPFIELCINLTLPFGLFHTNKTAMA